MRQDNKDRVFAMGVRPSFSLLSYYQIAGFHLVKFVLFKYERLELAGKIALEIPFIMLLKILSY